MNNPVSHTFEEVHELEILLKSKLGEDYGVYQHPDGSLVILYDREQVMFASEELKKALGTDWEVFEDTRGVCVYSVRLVNLINLLESPKCLYVITDEEASNLNKLLLVSSFEEASNKWHSLTGYELIDRRDTTEYTNVNAQRDPDFWNEEKL